MKIDLPWPHKLLWPNGSVGNRHAKAREVKKHRSWAFLATLEAVGGERPVLPLPLPITLHVHAKRFGTLPDADNCVAALKSSLDGIADALKVNDRAFASPVVKYAPERDGRFVVELGV